MGDERLWSRRALPFKRTDGELRLLLGGGAAHEVADRFWITKFDVTIYVHVKHALILQTQCCVGTIHPPCSIHRRGSEPMSGLSRTVARTSGLHQPSRPFTESGPA